MQVFYAPGISEGNYCLDSSESKHIVRVLRMRKGSRINMIDGKGNLYECIITEPDPAGCTFEIKSVTPEFEKRNYRLHIAISPLKNPERLEWFIEKAVEIGIDEITPVICRNTEKPGIKPERLRSIIVSSMKQSLKAFEPVLNPAVDFDGFISCGHSGKVFISHCNRDFQRRKITEVYEKGEDAVILIGPEGDFTREEILNAADRNIIQIHLGRSRLRTETAGLAACHSVYLINQ